MKVLFAGGGTGGHIYPAISIATALKRRDPSTEILLVGTGHGMESELVPHAGFALSRIHLYGFQRQLSVRNIKNIVLLGKSLWDVRQILRDFRPDVVVGTGGYVCGPVVLQAARAGIPTLIQEQNAWPGITNRILGRFVDVVALGYAEAAGQFMGRRAQVVVTGNPVREDLLSADRQSSCRYFGFRDDLPVVLITGGSQGARSINQATLSLHRRQQDENKAVQILHITGNTDYNNIIRSLQTAGVSVNTPGAASRVLPYVHEMPKALAAASLVVSRAGAIGLAELSLRGVPAILIPYPHAAENHQEVNARALEKKGAAIVVRDAELTGTLLCSMMESLVFNRERLAAMTVAAASAGQPDAVDSILRLVVALAERKK